MIDDSKMIISKDIIETNYILIKKLIYRLKLYQLKNEDESLIKFIIVDDYKTNADHYYATQSSGRGTVIERMSQVRGSLSDKAIDSAIRGEVILKPFRNYCSESAQFKFYKKNSAVYENLHNCSGIFVDPDYQCMGIGSIIYRHLLAMGYDLVSNGVQSYEARRLWSKLSLEAGVNIAVIDLRDLSIISRSQLIGHARFEGGFDTQYYSDADKCDYSKAGVRFVMSE